MTYGNGMVSWQNYEGVAGFSGQSSPGELQELQKALVAGNAINAPGSQVAGDGFALRVESLERTLKNTTFRMEHVRFWRGIPKVPAYNTVEEFNQVLSYGNVQSGAWVTEGALPAESDATYKRNYVTIKFMGVTRRVSHVASVIKPAHGNVIAQETIAGTMDLLQQVEQNLFYARSDLDPVQFDGLEKQIEDGVVGTSGNIIDLRGKPLSEDVLMDAALTIMDAPNYGLPTHLYLNPKTKTDLVKTFFPKARYDLFNKTDTGLVGLDIKGFTSPAGDIRFEPDVFITDGGGVAGLVALGNASAVPSSPVISQAAADVGATAGSLFGASDIGQYFYWVVAVNAFGQSAPVQVNGSAVTVAAAGDAITFGVTPGGGPAPTYYKVFRTAVGSAANTARQILRVASAGSGQTLVTDLNARLPGTTSAFMIQQNIENLEFKQLMPLIKIPLAVIDPSIRWMQLLYGAPVLTTPRHNVVFRNIGRSADYVGAP